MFYLLSLLASLLTGQRATLAHVAPRSRARSPVVTPPWDHLDHMFARFERLYADWRDGVLPEPCARADLPGTGTARLSRPTLPNIVLPDPVPAPAPAPQLPPSAAPRSPLLRQRPRPVMDAITPAPNLLEKPA